MTASPPSDGCTTIYAGPQGPERDFHTSPDALDEDRDRIVSFVRATVTDADAEGIVVAMSGVVDSTLTATLAVEALGGDPELGRQVVSRCTETAHKRECPPTPGLRGR